MTKQACYIIITQYIHRDVANIIIDYAYDKWLKIYTNDRYTYTDGHRVISKRYTPYDVYDITIYYCGRDNFTIVCADLDFNILHVIKLYRLILGLVCTKDIIFIEHMDHVEKYNLSTNSIVDKIATNARLSLIYENKLICRYANYIYIYSLDLKFIKTVACSSYIKYVYIADNMLTAVLDTRKEELILIE
jgi:hypothetical protein